MPETVIYILVYGCFALIFFLVCVLVLRWILAIDKRVKLQEDNNKMLAEMLKLLKEEDNVSGDGNQTISWPPNN